MIGEIATNPFFRAWGLFGGLLSAVALLCGLFWWLLRRDAKDVEANILRIKASITALFMRAIVDEARILIGIVDEHLPVALTQGQEQSGGQSRFDLFCESLKALANSEVERSGTYLSIVREAFSGLLSGQVRRLLGAVYAEASTPAQAISNPTGISYEISGDSALKMLFVSYILAEVTRNETRYAGMRRAALIFSLLSIIMCLCLLPAVFVDAGWVYSAFLVAGGAGLVSFLLTMCCTLRHWWTGDAVERCWRKCNDAADLDRMFAQWKAGRS